MHFVAAGLMTALVSSLVAAAPSPVPSSSAASTASKLELLMPSVQPTEPDTYLCNAVKVDEAHRYLIEFEPKADSHTAHHVLLYGCTEPGMAPGHVWNCGEMSSSSSDVPQGNVCQSGHSILYAWAMDAPKLELPTGVGFDVGQETEVPYLVLQVHYHNVSKFLPPESTHDNSGLIIHTTDKRTPKQAGVYLLATGGGIPAKSVEYFESACQYDSDKEIVPFAYRVHAHSLGRVISGYRVRDGKWTELGREDPRLPEMFYDVTTPNTTIKRGDILAARCTMENTEEHRVNIGNTKADEMCNFYLMFYVENPPTPEIKQCVTPGPPSWYWKDFSDQTKINLEGVPKTASTLPASGISFTKTATAPESTQYRTPTRQEFLDEFPAQKVDSDSLLGVSDEMMANGIPSNDEMFGSMIRGDNEFGDSGIPGTFQEQSVEQLLDEAINNMNPDELLYLIQQLAKEEDEEARRQLWLEKQRAREQHYFPNYNRF